MKRKLALIFSLVMCVSLCTPVFAIDTSSDIRAYSSQASILEMTIDELSLANANNSELTGTLNAAQQNYSQLYSYIANPSILDQLSVYDLDTITDVIETNSLSHSQAANLINSWNTSESYSPSIDIKYAKIHADQQENKLSFDGIATNLSRAYSGGITSVGSGDLTGVHYMVRSTSDGFNKASGTIELPTVTLRSSANDPDVPYVMFGFYVGSDLGFDLGACYMQSDSKWHFFISGYVSSSEGGYTRFYKEMSDTFSPNSLPSVNLVARIAKGSNSDVLYLTAIDTSSWTEIDTIDVDTGTTGFTPDFSGYKAGADRSYVSSTYGNVYVNREVTLAHKSQSGRTLTGTTIEDAEWSAVYLYTTSGYNLWGTSQTQSARKIGETSDYANTVNVSITNKWYQDTTDIYYR